MVWNDAALVHRGKHPGKSSVMFLSMLDMNSNDDMCVLQH